MCLDRLEAFPTKGYGWKAFDKDSDGNLSGLYTYYEFPVNRWLDANANGISTTLQANHSIHTYKSGFHIYSSRESARATGGTVRKVKFKNVITTGMQCGHRVIVAKNVLVIPSKKRSSRKVK
jgi:hypothetical protein